MYVLEYIEHNLGKKCLVIYNLFYLAKSFIFVRIMEDYGFTLITDDEAKQHFAGGHAATLYCYCYFRIFEVAK